MKKRRFSLVILSLFLIVAVLGCAAKVANQSTGRGSPPAPAVEAPAAAPKFGDAGGAEESRSAVSQDTARMIIMTVNMSMLVNDTEQTLLALQEIVSGYQGYTADSRKWYVNEQPYATITVRIPAGSLDAAMAQIRALAIRVESENISGQDVTEEYTDLQARLRNLEATEKELLALLTEVRENQGKAEEILAVHRELTSIRGEIESLKGRQQYLERMTALATIQIEIRPKAAPASLSEPAAWNPVVIASRALRTLVDVAKALATLAIYVIFLSPLIIVPAVVLWLIVRALQRRRARKNAEATPQGDTPEGGTPKP
jgi:hypothetical protein